MSAPVQSEPRSTFERVLARRTDDLSQRQAERATELVQQGAGQRDRRRRVTLARVAGAALGLLFLRLVFGGTPGRRGNEPIGAGAVATADGAGVGSSVSAFLPPAGAKAASESTPTTGPALPAPQSAAHTSSAAAVTKPRIARPTQAGDSTRVPAPAPAFAPPLLLAADDAQGNFAVEVGLPGAKSSSASSAQAAAAVINVGTRLRATLEAPLRTGSALAPATATLAEDLRDGDHVLLSAGTRLVGNAFATPNDDRVQIVWRAIVCDGRTLAVQAETLGSDGAPGLPGKVIRRHRRGVLRRIGSTLAATAGDAAGYVLPLGDTALEQASAALAGRAGRELGQLGNAREWVQADTVVELKAGTPIVVYVSADIALGQAGGR